MGDPLFTPALVGAVVSVLVAKVIETCKRAYYCKEHCKTLQATLEGVSPLVDKVIRKADGGNSTCCAWLSSLEALLRDAESATEECGRKSISARLKRAKLSSRITNIDQQIKEKTNQAALVALDILQDVWDAVSKTTPKPETKPPQFVIQPVPAKIVAFEADPFGKLKKLIMDAAHATGNPITLGLKGRGGAGKTMLAGMLNNDPEVKAKYGADSILWITVGHDARDVESVHKTLGSFLNDGEFERSHAHKSLEDQHAYLMEALKKKRVLLILDDVWEVECDGHEMIYWLDVAKGPGSVTLITTRNDLLLDRVVAKEKVAVLSLSKEESWELFRCHAFQRGGPPSDRVGGGITGIAKEICKECKGLPLALRVIGSAMLGKVSMGEWRSALRHLGASEGMENSKIVDGALFHRLRFSYDELDENAKKCFLYFAAFPEDEAIDIRRLTAMWNAEGLFGPLDGEAADDAGRTHLLALEKRSLIELRGDGLEYAKIHDILRDLAFHIIREAGPNDWASECFFQPGKVLKMLPPVKESARRMSFMEGGTFGWPSTVKVPNLRVCLVGRSARSRQSTTEDLPSSFFSSMSDMRYLEMIGCSTFLKNLPEGMKELTSLMHLDLSKTNLQELPEGIKELTSLRFLNLSRTQLKVLPKGIKELTSLETLDLSGTQLQQLPECIKGLTSLRFLNLSRTQLKVLPEGIKELTSLETLDLSGTQLQELPEGIKKLTSLMFLDLSRTQLKELPEGIKELTSLTELDLSGTQLQQLPDGIKELMSLTKLNLSRTQLQVFPEGIKELTSLTYLDLAWTQLQELPDGVKELTSLRYLNLSWTQLQVFPEGIKELTSLTKLRLLGTQLQELPEGIKELTSLIILNLSGTQLKELPEGIKGLTSLTKLNLSGTQLQELSEGIKGLTSLTKLDLSGTQLQVLPEGIKELTSLTYLDLSGTQLKELFEGIKGLTSLTYLDLSRTQLQELPEGTKELTSLMYLDLSGTQLQELPEGMKELTSLKYLNLSGTQLQVLPKGIKALTALTELNLSGTQLHELLEGI